MNEDIQAHPGSLKPTGADLAVPYKGGVNCKGPEVTNLLDHTVVQQDSEDQNFVRTVKGRRAQPTPNLQNNAVPVPPPRLVISSPLLGINYLPLKHRQLRGIRWLHCSIYFWAWSSQRHIANIN